MDYMEGAENGTNSSILMGRQQMRIEETYDEYIKNPIQTILSNFGKMLSSHNNNVSDYIRIENYYRGNHNILNKTRANNDTSINNKITANHVSRIVDFKKSIMVASPIEYAVTNSKQDTDDMVYFHKYLVDSRKSSYDIQKYEDLYKYGVALQMIYPRKEKNYDVETQSPFEILHVSPDKGFCFYTSDIGNRKIGCVLLGTKIINNKRQTVYHIYLNKNDINNMNNYYVIYSNSSNENSVNGYVILEQQKIFANIPLVEFYLNQSRMGIVEQLMPLQDMANQVLSGQLDDIEQAINHYIVLYNQDLDDADKETFIEFKKQKILSVNTSDPNKPADLKLLSQSLDTNAVMEVYNSIVKTMEDLVGAPSPSGNATSGGDTGDARALGNGWENAQLKAETDATFISNYERDGLQLMVDISYAAVNSPMGEISCSDIDIKYSINIRHNLIIKTQSLQTLYNMDFPLNESLAITGLVHDVDGVAKNWQERIDDIKEQENQEETNSNTSTTVTENIDVVKTTTEE